MKISKFLYIYFILFLVTSSAFSENQNEEIRLGIMAPLTGDYATAGLDIQRGAEIAASELRENNFNIKLIFENACLPAEGVSAVKKLLSSDKIDALASNYCLITLNAILPIVNENKLVTFQNSVSPLELINQSPYMYTAREKEFRFRNFVS
jgi:branched-chain amino acid transport system substrate-binding protein